MMKQMKYAAVLAALAFGAQSAMAEDAAKSADDSAQAGAAGQAQDNQGTATGAASDTGATGASDDAAQPAAGRAAAKAGQSGRAGAQAAQGSKDQMFVREAASGGMLEVALGQLAAERAQRDEIKQHAQQVVQDHTKANQQLMQIAKSKGIQIERQMKPSHQAKLDELSQLQGEDFEKAYLYSDLALHVYSVLKFRDASQELQDEDLKSFATQQLPILKQHLAHVAQAAQWEEATTAGATEHAEHGSDTTGGASDGATTPAPGGSQQRPGAKPGQPGDAGGDTGGDTGSDTGAGSTGGAGGASGAGQQ